jgi:hypothetical protein
MPPRHGKLQNLDGELAPGPIDIFLCCASFEDRCKSISTAIDVSRIGKAVIALNIDHKALVEANFAYLEDRFSGKHQRLELSTTDPISTADNIVIVLGNLLLKDPQRIVIDITTFTREGLLILLRFLRTYITPDHKLEFLYAHAREYSIGDPVQDKWLSKGIREVRSVLGYPGALLPSRPNHLIILVGFEDQRALELIRECEPSRISLGIADRREEGTGPHQATNVHRFTRLRSILQVVDGFTFHGYDPDATMQALAVQVKKAIGFNTIIAPMNTKISTLGAAALALSDPSIQLCYAQANSYNYARYSAPDDDYYLCTLPGSP